MTQFFSPIEAAKNIAGFIVSDDFDSSIDDFYRELSRDSDFELDSEKLAHVRAEDRFLHLIDRLAYSRLRPGMRDVFMEALCSAFADEAFAADQIQTYMKLDPGVLKSNAIDVLRRLEGTPEIAGNKAKYAEECRDAYNLRQREYAFYTFGPRVEGQPLRNDLCWEYGKKISDLLHPGGPWPIEIMSVSLRATGLAQVASACLESIGA